MIGRIHTSTESAIFIQPSSNFLIRKIKFSYPYFVFLILQRTVYTTVTLPNKRENTNIFYYYSDLNPGRRNNCFSRGNNDKKEILGENRSINVGTNEKVRLIMILSLSTNP